MTDQSKVRTFSTGATRNADSARPDPEGYLSPLALDRFFEYMHKHQYLADGSRRDSDNWQKGIPFSTYIKGMWRHFFHLWTRHRGWPVTDPLAAVDAEEDLCAIIFNAQGHLHELIKARLMRSAIVPQTYKGAPSSDHVVRRNCIPTIPPLQADDIVIDQGTPILDRRGVPRGFTPPAAHAASDAVFGNPAALATSRVPPPAIQDIDSIFTSEDALDEV